NGEALPAPVIVRCSDGSLLAECEAGWLQANIDGVDDTGEVLATGLSRTQMAAQLEEVAIRTAPVNSVHDAIAMPQTAARELFFAVETRGARWPLMASPLRLARTPPRVREPMPPLGEDNEAILGTTVVSGRSRSKAAR